MGCEHRVNFFDLRLIWSKFEVWSHRFQLLIITRHNSNNFGVYRPHAHERSKKLLWWFHSAHVGQSQLTTSFLSIAHPSRTLWAYNRKNAIFTIKFRFLISIDQFRLEFPIGKMETQCRKNTQIIKFHSHLTKHCFETSKRVEIIGILDTRLNQTFCQTR